MNSIPIPDFLRNQQNLVEERKAQVAPCYGKMVCGKSEYESCPVRRECGNVFAAKHPDF